MDSIQFQKFDGKNFHIWKNQLCLVLEEEDLLDQLGEEKTYVLDRKRDLKTRCKIMKATTTTVYEKIVVYETAAEMWKHLRRVYESSSRLNTANLLQEYFAYEKSTNDDMATHISKVEQLALKLKGIGQEQTQEAIMAKLLTSLPTEFKMFRKAFESLDEKLQTKDELITRLLKEEVEIKSEFAREEKFEAHLAEVKKRGYNRTPQPGRDKKKEIEEKKKKTKCHKCKKVGHWARECPENRQTKPQSSESQDMMCMMEECHYTQADEDLLFKWCADSAANRHICHTRGMFETYTPRKSSLFTGTHQETEVLGVGTVRLIDSKDESKPNIVLTNVLYCPSVKRNLLSIGEADEKGFIVTFGKGKVNFCKNNQLVMTGTKLHESSRLYILDNMGAVCNEVMLMESNRTLDQWHRAFGHVNKQTILEMAKNKVVSKLNIKSTEKGEHDANCEVCPAAKMAHSSHPEKVNPIELQVGDQIDMDLIGKVSEKTILNEAYALIARDKSSNYCFVELLKSKDEVADKIQRIIASFEPLTGRTIRRIQCDNGGEFKNERVAKMCDYEHIKMQFSAPYTPQQNGGAERTNRTLQNMARAMLLESSLDNRFWGEALLTAAYISNRIMRKRLNCTPFEICTGRKPRVDHLVPFGTEVQAKINDRQCHKFDARTEDAYIVGFTERSNTYKIVTKNGLKIKTSCDIAIRKHLDRESSKQEINEEMVNFALNGSQRTKISSKQLNEFFDTFVQDLRQEEPNQPRVTNINDNSQHNQVLQPSNDSMVSGCALTNDTSADVTSPSFSVLSGFDSRYKTCVEPRSSTPMNDSNPFINDEPLENEVNLTIEGCHSLLDDVPSLFINAVTGKDKLRWQQAVKEELLAHQVNGTWTVINRPPDTKLLSSRWIFTIKRDKDGQVSRYKARLVARGFEQRPGIDFIESYAPVARHESVRFLLAICAQLSLNIRQFDISTAFLYGDLNEAVYMHAPDGVKIGKHQCLKLVKSLYGLRQAPRAWHSKLSQTLKTMGFSPLQTEPCIFTDSTKQAFVCTYVDDGLICAKTLDKCEQIMECLAQSFAVKNTTGNLFIGINIQASCDSIFISQKLYAENLVAKFGMQDCLGSNFINLNTIELEKLDDKETNKPYRSLIGGLLYLAIASRPDLLYATTFLSRFNSKPLEKHWNAAKSLLRYVKQTSELGILYCKQEDEKLIAYSDADWAADKSDRKSVSGGLVCFAGAPIIYFSRKQTAIALSSCESELIAAAETCKSLKWLVMLADELKLKMLKPLFYIDNQSAINLIRNDITHRRSRHIDLKYFFVRHECQANLFELKHISSKQQLADIFTKIIPEQLLVNLRKSCSILKQPL